MISDADLLRAYACDHDQHAFAEFVRRHAGLVYAAALRRTAGRVSLAEEISQKIFTTVAQRAALFRHHPALAAWLHRSTRHAAIDALRAETRRHLLARSLFAMPAPDASPGPPVDWERLRPVLDDALDQLRPADRELMLLRYFQGLTFAEIGARLTLAENAARMRTDRALDRLRGHLERRGVTSTAAALGLLLGHQWLAAAPAGLASGLSSSALAATPPFATTVITALFMSKITAPLVTAALAAGLSAVVYTAATDSVGAAELASLRRDHARLTQATAAGADPAALRAAAGEYEHNVATIARLLDAKRHRATASSADASPAARPATPAAAGAASSPAADPRARGYSDRGRATPRDAVYTFGWAGAMSDPDAFARTIYLDDAARAKALELLARMPDSIRAQCQTAEQFCGLILAAATLEGPPPDADTFERSSTLVELRPDRVAVRRSGSTANYHEYQLTPDGWKWVLPARAIEPMSTNLSSATLARLAAQP